MNENEQILKKVKTNQILLFILIGITTVTLLSFAIAGLFAMRVYHEISPVVAQLEELDVDSINGAMKTVSGMQDFDFEKINEALNSMDFEGLEESLEAIDFEGIGKLLSSIDVEEMQSAMDNLNKASEMLENVSEKVTPILKWFK